MNDMVIYDIRAEKIIDHVSFSEGHVCSRIYHAGFKIGSKIYTYGGMAANGSLLDSLEEIDYKTRRPLGKVTIERGAQYLEKMHSTAITPVFYNKNASGGPELVDLQIENLIGDVNWGDATDLIKHEGFYMFGGKKPNNEASNAFLVIQVKQVPRKPG